MASSTQPPTGKLKTTSQLEPQTFCDFLGEVIYTREDFNPSRFVMVLTDYTDHELHPRDFDGLTKIAVTLWDEHHHAAKDMDLQVGEIVYLKNLICKINKKGILELVMNGFRGKGYRNVNPIQRVGIRDDVAHDLRGRQTRYQFEREGVTDGANTGSAPTTSSASTSTIQPPSSSGDNSSIQPPLERTGSWQSRPEALPTNNSPQRVHRAGSHVVVKVFDTEESPTKVALEKLRTQVRQSAKSKLAQRLSGAMKTQASHYKNVQFMMIRARVIDFYPRKFEDFSELRCNNCKRAIGVPSDGTNAKQLCCFCKKGGKLTYQYNFMLTLEDGIGQIYNVRVDDEGGRTLFGQELAAGIHTKDQSLPQKLKDKLERIGVIEESEPSGITFECCLELTRLTAKERAGQGTNVIDLDLEEQTTDNQKVHGKKRKADASDDQSNKNGRVEEDEGPKGLRIQGWNDDRNGDFKARLVHTIITR
ncbi:hypothetical protein BGX31_009303 [Mortierella sp. GBA43]|nr:hypothetical protein BGX31_009303 [Mortierella sp. GBA43]